MMDKNENKAMIEAVALLAKEKNIGKEVLFTAIEEALKSASTSSTVSRPPMRTSAWSSTA